VLGTPNYIAPEVLDAQRYNGHSFQVDIWGLGIIIYILLFGKPPFDSPEVKQTYGKIRINDYEYPKDSRVSEGAKDLINRMLVTDPEQRLDLPSLLKHVWMKGPEKIPNRLPQEFLN